MKKQLVHIHGGGAWPSYADSLKYLRDYIIYDPTKPQKARWKDNYNNVLGLTWQIIKPEMPNKRNVKYKEWKIWFNKYVPYLRDDVILVGHSLGGAFLVKYLSENLLPVKIRQLHLVAAVHWKSLGVYEFKVSGDNLSNILKQCDNIFIYQSIDDKSVSSLDAKAYHKMLPEAKFMEFKDRGHFLQAEFPELIKNILEN